MPRPLTARRSRLIRLLAVVGALLQMLAGPAAAWAEGQVASRTGLAQAHVEAERSSTCVAVHADDCALCQMMSAVSAPATPSASLVAVQVAQVAPRELRIAIAGGTRSGEPPSRAPPSPA
ncbi:MAG: hypothetical protein HY275_16120 [Gemmatimonadetes bacterium]|nr:hypothetical protein [Gemmatimonadota bacterium]